MMKRSRLRLFLLTSMLLPAGAMADTVIIFQNNYGPQHYGFSFVSADPYDYEKVPQGPRQVSITFNQPPDEQESRIEVFNLYGAPINDGNVTIDGNRMSVSLPSLTPGRYKVKWKAQCHCSERIRLNDVFRFTVR